MPFPGAKTFPLSNPASQCAAFSQSWLVFSFLHGAPVTNLTLMNNKTIMNSIQATAGGPSATALPANGLQINGTPVVLNNHNWTTIFQRLMVCQTGAYYLTSKNPHHAMACWMQGGGAYYLEPEEGLFWIANRSAFPSAAATWYAARTGSPTNTEFKIHAVTSAGSTSRSTTAPRRAMMGRQRIR